MPTGSSILAREIPCTEEPSVLPSMGLQGVIHNAMAKQKQHIFAGNHCIFSQHSKLQKNSIEDPGKPGHVLAVQFYSLDF